MLSIASRVSAPTWRLAGLQWCGFAGLVGATLQCGLVQLLPHADHTKQPATPLQNTRFLQTSIVVEQRIMSHSATCTLCGTSRSRGEEQHGRDGHFPEMRGGKCLLLRRLGIKVDSSARHGCFESDAVMDTRQRPAKQTRALGRVLIHGTRGNGHLRRRAEADNFPRSLTIETIQ